MKLSEQWLREWVNPTVDNKVLAEQLTMAGLEVDSITPAAPAFNHVVVGLIKAVVPHPDADRLRTCTVDVGAAEPLQIVCGAPNARVGIKIPVALVGALLPGDFKINQSKIRGVESFGMLCSAKELGLIEEANGIMELLPDAPMGVDIGTYLKLDDQIIEIELTPNRGDCLSIQGVAREVAAINHLGILKPDFKEVASTIQDTFPVTVHESKACPRYLGRVVRGINTAALTPLWMQERLRRSGLRSIHPVVDIMNMVMLELGQPMHAFDLNRLQGGLHVRLAKMDESINLLDEQTLTLKTSTLVIADEKAPQAVAGIMGGRASAVSAETQDLFLESAFFQPSQIALEARQYGLQSDSSYRFERGVNPELPRLAMNRVSELILEIVGGRLGPITEVTNAAEIPQRPIVDFALVEVERLLGIQVKEDKLEALFNGLGIQIISKEKTVWKLKAPSFRFDLNAEADFIEEVARLVGYDHIPSQAQWMSAHILSDLAHELSTAKISKTLVDRGYQEVISYSFIDAESQQLFDPKQSPVRLKNPLTQDMAVMRTSLWPGLLKISEYNLARQSERVRLFEKGLCFVNDQQTMKLGGLITGNYLSEQWAEKSRKVDFFDLKADIEALLQLSKHSQEVKWLNAEHPALHPGQSARLELEGQLLGYVGALHPRLVQALDVKSLPYLFELNLELLKQSESTHYKAISKFPSMRRDVAMIVDQALRVAELQEKIQLELGECLNNLIIFDIYEGQPIEAGKKSVALGLVFQDPSRNLVDEEINALVARVIKRLENDFKISLRT